MTSRAASRLRKLPSRLLAALWFFCFPLISGFSYVQLLHGEGVAGYTFLTKDKWWAALVLAGLSILLVILDRCLNRRPFRLTLPMVLGLAYFVWVALSAFLGTAADLLDIDGRLITLVGFGREEGLQTHLIYAVIFLCLCLAAPDAETICLCAGAAILPQAALISLQYAGQNPLGLYPARWSILTKYEYQGTIGNIDFVNAWLCLAVGLAIGFFILRGGWKGGFALFCAAVGMLLQRLMEVQSALVAMLAGACVALLLAAIRPALRSRVGWAGVCLLLAFFLRRRIALPWLDGSEQVAPVLTFGWLDAAFLLLMAALAALALRFRRHPGQPVPLGLTLLIMATAAAAALTAVRQADIPPEMGGLYELHALLNGHAEDSFGSWRIGCWTYTLQLCAESPFFGYGPATFWRTFTIYLAELGVVLGENFDAPHNLFLGILFVSGIPALLCFLACAGLAVRRVRRAPAGPALALALLCYLAQGQFTFSLPLITPLLFALLGAMSGTAQIDQKGDARD